MKKRQNIISMYGGLGNQMFQYVLYLYLKNEHIDTKISFSNFLLQKHHNGIDIARAFKLNLSLKNKILFFITEYCEFIIYNKYSQYLIRRIIPKVKTEKLKIYIEKKEFVKDNNIINLRQSLIIGTWQSLLYFQNIENRIVENFVFCDPRDKRNEEIVARIKMSNSVSIHVRRGDYLNSNWSLTHNVIKNTRYYTEAIKFIKNHVSEPTFFIFSDDISWTKENLQIPNAIYVDHNKNKYSYIDMYLMSICKNNIIANSTFSWWGAWLNQNKNKIIITPKVWIKEINCCELIPNDWISIDV
ncbi:MAG: alpha-1,2-fucosyltransferase [Prolixibacteraceae bacterium]|nr:alpha-1,2-fucosyltransferase [Prolixibacteraceae bacterium]